MSEKLYPGVSERIKAIVFDNLAMVVLLLIASSIIEANPDMPLWSRYVLFWMFIAYDPVTTAFFGGTIGHYAVGIRVKSARREGRNIWLPTAVIRFVVKYTLGLISLISISLNAQGRTLHDLISGSVVVYKEETKYE